MNGDWSREKVSWIDDRSPVSADFVTSEATVVSEGIHRLLVKYFVGETEKEIYASLSCKGTQFSCSVFDFRITSCESNNGAFVAEFTTTGLNAQETYPEMDSYSIDDVSILLITDKQYCDTNGACASTAGIPLKASLNEISPNNYRIEWPKYTSNVKSLSIKFNPGEKCLRQNIDYEYSINDYKICDPDPFVNKFVCTGCESGEVCIKEGTSVVKNGITLYCSNKKLLEQKPLGALCSANAECSTNYCFSGRCTEELLRRCDEGLLFESCKCGNVDVRDYDSKYCCAGTVKNTACNEDPFGQENNSQNSPTCEAGEVLDDGICVKVQKEGFFDKFINFLKSLFSR